MTGWCHMSSFVVMDRHRFWYFGGDLAVSHVWWYLSITNLFLGCGSYVFTFDFWLVNKDND